MGVAAGVILACAFAVTVATPAQAASRPQPRPVPSLEPAKTKLLWTKLVRRRRPAASATTADCRPLRAVFYTSTDWLRLATKLAAASSPCAQYYISIPPLAADKTAFRWDQPWRIRALGPQFHVLAEIHWTGWSSWVATTGHTYYEAGLEARRRMAASGFDVASGDTWIVNELSSAVRKGTGVARANVREFVRGLHDGDGTVPVVKGAVFITGMASSTSSLADYKVRLQDWYGDAAFWSDMSAYVSDWSQELYGDVATYAVPGADLASRRAHLDDYLQHELALADAGPDSVAGARGFLHATYSPLANAAWTWTSGFGRTDVPLSAMQDFVSAQTYALRSYSARKGLADDHFGFAWSPRNVDNAPWTTDFVAQSGQLIDRLAAAIRDSAQPVDLADPGVGACGPAGQNSWCSAELAGGAFNEAWKTFATWSPPGLGFATAPLALTAGDASGPVSVRLQTIGVLQTATAPTDVTLSTSSPVGGLAASTAGPWTPTLTVTIPVAGSATPSVYYRDTKAGSVTLTASSAGRLNATQTETVAAAPLARLAVAPSSATVLLGASRAFAATGTDTYGNAVPVVPAWSLDVGTPGTLSAASGTSTTFTASTTATGSGGVVATVGTVTARAPVAVVAPKARVSSIVYALSSGRLVLTLTVLNASTGKPVAGAAVWFAVWRDTSGYFAASRTTGADGKATYVTASPIPTGCYTTKVTQLTATEVVWDGVTPANRFCR
ncbi:MAG: hypothetical protein QOE36_257 [Gaiellaceae bacterium]|nr:hypothetical protein [Gaiellaceae bacterium]